MPKRLARRGPTAFIILYRGTGHARSFVLRVRLWGLYHCWGFVWAIIKAGIWVIVAVVLCACTMAWATANPSLYLTLFYLCFLMMCFFLVIHYPGLPSMSSLISKMLEKYLEVCKISRNSHAGSILDGTSEAQCLGGEERPMARLMEGIVGSTCPFCFQFWFAQVTLCLVNESGWAGIRRLQKHWNTASSLPLAQSKHGYLQLAGRWLWRATE